MANRPNVPDSLTLCLSRRRLVQAGAGLAAACLPLGPALAQNADRSAPRNGTAGPRKGGILRLAITPATLLDPVKLNSPGAIAIVQQAAEYLVQAGPDLRLKPVLATSWQAADDARTWTFELRRGVRFHDGRPMTAGDVAATFRRLVDPAFASPVQAALNFLKPEGVTTAGDHTVVFRLDRPIGSFPYYTNLYNAVILPADYAGNFADRPIGTGPFRLVRYSPQQGARFERNPDYWDAPRPYLDGVEMQIFDSSQPMVLALLAGATDAIQQVSAADARALAGNPGITLIETESADHRQLTLRTDRKPFDDKRVRQAVALCLDRQALVDGLLGGRATIANDHPIAPIYPERVQLPQRTIDLARARALLQDAGHPTGFEVDLHTHPLLELPQCATLIQQMLAPVGIRANLRIEPTSLYYDHWTDVPMGLTEWTSRPAIEQLLAQSFLSGAEWNAAHWKNPEFDALVARLEAAAAPAERSGIATRIAAILNDEVPAPIPYFVRTLRAAGVHVRDLPGSMSNHVDLTASWLAS